MSPGHTYQGRLAVDGETPELVVYLRLEGGAVELHTSFESLGQWPIANVSVSRLADGRFALQLGDDKAFFRADDPLGFSYDATSALQTEQARFRHRLHAFMSVGNSESRRSNSDPAEEAAASSNSAATATQPRLNITPPGRHLRGVELGA